jgi:hypothetical protein
VDCVVGEEPDVFAPISAEPSPPSGSTETPKMTSEDAGQEAARQLAELYAAMAAHAATAAKCMADVYNWPSAK